MLPTLPSNAARSPRWRRLVLAVALASCAGLTRASWAIEVMISPARIESGTVWNDVQLTDVLSSRVEGSVDRGMPATLRFHSELWRRRTAWFDRLESSFDASLRFRYETWSKRYRIERKGQAPIIVSSLDSLRLVLARPLALPVGPVPQLKSAASYYVVVSVTLMPLSVEDVEEGEGWLTGEVETKRRAGLGIVTAIPRSLFDAVRNFSGFGDERARAISRDFRITDEFGTPEVDLDR